MINKGLPAADRKFPWNSSVMVWTTLTFTCFLFFPQLSPPLSSNNCTFLSLHRVRSISVSSLNFATVSGLCRLPLSFLHSSAFIPSSCYPSPFSGTSANLSIKTFCKPCFTFSESMMMVMSRRRRKPHEKNFGRWFFFSSDSPRSATEKDFASGENFLFRIKFSMGVEFAGTASFQPSEKGSWKIWGPGAAFLNARYESEQKTKSFFFFLQL